MSKETEAVSEKPMAGFVGPPVKLTGVKMPDDPIVAGPMAKKPLEKEKQKWPTRKSLPAVGRTEESNKINSPYWENEPQFFRQRNNKVDNPIGKWITKHIHSLWWIMLSIIATLGYIIFVLLQQR